MAFEKWYIGLRLFSEIIFWMSFEREGLGSE